jgi:hypothetical protein
MRESYEPAMGRARRFRSEPTERSRPEARDVIALVAWVVDRASAPPPKKPCSRRSLRSRRRPESDKGDHAERRLRRYCYPSRRRTRGPDRKRGAGQRWHHERREQLVAPPAATQASSWSALTPENSSQPAPSAPASSPQPSAPRSRPPRVPAALRICISAARRDGEHTPDGAARGSRLPHQAGSLRAQGHPGAEPPGLTTALSFDRRSAPPMLRGWASRSFVVLRSVL